MRWCSQMLAKGMSRTSTSSSWLSSKTTCSTSAGSTSSPAKSSSYILATRAGVPRMEASSTSRPRPSSINRTPASTLAWSKEPLGSAPVRTRTRSSGTATGGRSDSVVAMSLMAWSLSRPGVLAESASGRPRRAQPRGPAEAAAGGAAEAGAGPVGRRLHAAQLAHDRGTGDLAAVAVHERLDLARRPRDDPVEQAPELLLLHRLMLHERVGELLQNVAVGHQDLQRLVVGLVDQRAHLEVDLDGHLAGVVLSLIHI